MVIGCIYSCAAKFVSRSSAGHESGRFEGRQLGEKSSQEGESDISRDEHIASQVRVSC